MEAEERDIIAYLLGELGEDERRMVDDRLFADDAYLAKVEIQEDILIEQYARNELSAVRRKRFQDHFLVSPRRRQRTDLAHDLEMIFGRGKPEPARSLSQIWWGKPWLPFATCALALISLALNAWLALRLTEQRTTLMARERDWKRDRQTVQDQLDRLKAELAVSAQAVETEKGQKSRSPSVAGQKHPFVLSFALAPGIFRDSGEKVLQIPPEANALRLRLETDTTLGPGGYSVTIHSEEGVELWNGLGRPDSTGGAQSAVIVTVPAPILRPGRYLIAISRKNATDVIDDYSFRVSR